MTAPAHDAHGSAAYEAHPETTDALYRERAHLVAHLAALYPSCIGPANDVDEPGWAIVYIDGPAGQMTWHIAPRDLDLFGHVHAGVSEWDGHTTAEKYRRLDALSAAHGRIGAKAAPELAAATAELGRLRGLVTEILAALEHSRVYGGRAWIAHLPRWHKSAEGAA